jgi:hypothetical protein
LRLTRRPPRIVAVAVRGLAIVSGRLLFFGRAIVGRLTVARLRVPRLLGALPVGRFLPGGAACAGIAAMCFNVSRRRAFDSGSFRPFLSTHEFILPEARKTMLLAASH